MLAIINRGVPGSGKSTLVKALKEVAEEKALSISCHCTDDKFMVEGEYCFDFNRLGNNHLANFMDFKNSLVDNINIVICDNTNIKTKEFKKYLDEAKKKNYKRIAVYFEPDSLENHCKRNTHNVPPTVIENMITNLVDNRRANIQNQVIIPCKSDIPFEQRMREVAEKIVDIYVKIE